MEEAAEQREYVLIMADLHCYTAETNTNKAIFLQIKSRLKNIDDLSHSSHTPICYSRLEIRSTSFPETENSVFDIYLYLFIYYKIG